MTQQTNSSNTVVPRDKKIYNDSYDSEKALWCVQWPNNVKPTLVQNGQPTNAE